MNHIRILHHQAPYKYNLVLGGSGLYGNGRFSKLLKRTMRKGLPLLGNIARQVGLNLIPALASLGQDKLNKVSPVLGDVVGEVSNMATKRIAQNQKPSGEVADYISGKATELLARRMPHGSGARNFGSGSKNFGNGSRNFGNGSRNFGNGSRNFGGSILGEGAFSSLDVTRNIG